MTTVADLVTALHDIDAYKGKVCVSCRYGTRKDDGVYCRKGHCPAGLDDGCDDWRERPERPVIIQQRPRRRARK